MQPVLVFLLEFGGSATDAASILGPFYALQPVATTNVTVPYPGAARAQGSGVNDAVCQHGHGVSSFPVGLLTYNTTANRAIYDLFKDMVNKYPAMSSSIVQFEGPPMQAIKAVESDSTAYPHRGDNLLVYVYSLFIAYVKHSFPSNT